ncbi:hypothetical protein INR49_019835 [Caranx melampygus]|nr:hypothetical protein INR49_019835 [Caranx melampygus]
MDAKTNQKEEMGGGVVGVVSFQQLDSAVTTFSTDLPLKFEITISQLRVCRIVLRYSPRMGRGNRCSLVASPLFGRERVGTVVMIAHVNAAPVSLDTANEKMAAGRPGPPTLLWPVFRAPASHLPLNRSLYRLLAASPFQTLPDFPPRTRPFDVSAAVRDAGGGIFVDEEEVEEEKPPNEDQRKTRAKEEQIDTPSGSCLALAVCGTHDGFYREKTPKHKMAELDQLVSAPPVLAYDITVWVPRHHIIDMIRQGPAVFGE